VAGVEQSSEEGNRTVEDRSGVGSSFLGDVGSRNKGVGATPRGAATTGGHRCRALSMR
jgi:hypothetical protein